MDYAIEFDAVSLRFGQVGVLQDVSVRVPVGEVVAVLGPNGGGKSTLLKLVLGLLRPDSGTVRVLGQAPGRCGERIGYLPQHVHVPPLFPITVAEAVGLGLASSRRLHLGGGRLGREQARAVDETLELVGLGGFGDRLMSGLSGGQRQRAFIARALVSDPELLLLDEPTNNVDGSGIAQFYDLLAGLARNRTVVMVSHDISVLARGVTSVACVNRTLHYHPAAELSQEMVAQTYGGGPDCPCPVELITHGHVPHRVLGHHAHDGHGHSGPGQGGGHD